MSELPKADLKWFQHDRFGMFIHWGIYAMSGHYEWTKSVRCMTDEEYQPYFDHFEVDLFEPKSWAKAAAQAGMKYLVITTKHHDGFCIYDSHYTDYKITNTKFGRDALREIVDAFRAEGLHIGFYHSLLDWHHPDYIVDVVNHPLGRGKRKEDVVEYNKNRTQKEYIKYLHNSLRQLMTEYGKIDILWCDFSFNNRFETGKGKESWGSEELVKLVRTLQPGIIINDRLDLDTYADLCTEPENWCPEEDFKVFKGKECEAWEGCQTFSGAWGYSRDEMTWKPPKQCIDLLVNHVCRNGNMMMNVGPTSRGIIDERAMDRLGVYARWMKLHSKAIYGCGMAPEEFPEPRDCRYTYNKETNRLYLHVMNWPFARLRLKNLAGKISYAQLLYDGSEMKFENDPETGNVLMFFPVVQPKTEVPVIELILKEE